MTRIRRVHLSVGERKEWISLIPGNNPNSHRVIPEEGDEFEFTDNKSEPLETQIGKILVDRDPVAAD